MTINRREFIEAAGLVAGGVAVAGALEALPADAAEQLTTRVPVTAFVNGQPRTITVEPRATLLDALREQLRLTGTKKGCDRESHDHRVNRAQRRLRRALPELRRGRTDA
jgi:xanthine dehydrogenase YagT iron-sulfur-binding subunit